MSHTNYFLTDLKEFEKEDPLSETFDRYEFANHNIKKSMSLLDIQDLMSNKSKGSKASIFNERTIARMIVDLEKLVIYVWLLRESEKGWVEYDVGFLNQQ